MPDQTEALLKDIVARTAVMERIMLTMLATYAQEFDPPPRFAAALLAEVRQWFDGLGAQPDQGAQHLRERALTLLDQHEATLLAALGPRPSDG